LPAAAVTLGFMYGRVRTFKLEDLEIQARIKREQEERAKFQAIIQSKEEEIEKLKKQLAVYGTFYAWFYRAFETPFGSIVLESYLQV
jgi:hypothetical protein